MSSNIFNISVIKYIAFIKYTVSTQTKYLENITDILLALLSMRVYEKKLQYFICEQNINTS